MQLIYGSSQTVNLSDSLRHILSYKPVLTAKLDSRNSFITGKAAQIQGVKIGVTFRKSLSLGIGYNWLKTDFYQRVHVGNTYSYVAIVRLRYIAPYAEYIFYRKGPWEATVPLQIGLGRSFLQSADDGLKVRTASNRVVLYEPSMLVEYKVFNLVGIGFGVGYRLMLLNNKDIEQRFTSPTYALRIRLIFDEFYRIGKEKYDKVKNKE